MGCGDSRNREVPHVTGDRTIPKWRVFLETVAEYDAAQREARKEASRYLWLGAKAAIKAWRPKSDPTAERLYTSTLNVMGGERKGCASKIKTVALATVAYDLDVNAYGSLSGAYMAARRLALGLDADPDTGCTCLCHHHGM